MIRGWTLDAGAVIALQRGDDWMVKVMVAAKRGEAELTIPATALAESWRGGRGRSGYGAQRLIDVALVEPLTEDLAKRAGELVARVEGASTIDATVAVSAALRGDTVLTSDPADLQRLADDLGTISVWSPRTS